MTSFNFCFDGIEKGSIVAVSTIGVKKQKSHFMLGYNEMLSRIKPSKIICYGKPFDEMKGDIIEVDYAKTNNLSKSFLVTKTFATEILPAGIVKGGGSASGQSSGNPEPAIENFYDILNNPSLLKNITPKELYHFLKKNGYDVKPLSRGSLKNREFENGGGYKINYDGDGLFQYHPSGFHHGKDGYYKISNGKDGTVRYSLDGKIL